MHGRTSCSGKSYIGRKLVRFLNWVGQKAKVFNIGIYRRVKIGVDCDSTFFNADNKDALKARELCAIQAIQDLVNYLTSKYSSIIISDENGDIAVLDGTNSNSARRRTIEEMLKNKMSCKFKLIWIESICTLEDVIERNILNTKLSSPDYKSWQDPEKAVEDFRNRIREYEKVYETISKEKDGDKASFIQIINQGKEIVMRNIHGFREAKILSYLINLHTIDRPIYFTRHGESEFNIKNLIGGDSPLSNLGEKYASYLPEFFTNQAQSWKEFKDPVTIYVSTMRRALQTADQISFMAKPIVMKSLDEINCGLRDGLSYDEIKERYPLEHEERNKDKLNYRYPRGESYMDVIMRIEPVLFELERRRGPVIVVGHQGMIRCLYGYFACVPIESIPTLEIPIHTVIKFVPAAYGFTEERFIIDPITGNVDKTNKGILKYEDNLCFIPNDHNKNIS